LLVICSGVLRVLATVSSGSHGREVEKQADKAAISTVGMNFNVGISIKLEFYVARLVKIGC
jgi:hypothetical protein